MDGLPSRRIGEKFVGKHWADPVTGAVVVVVGSVHRRHDRIKNSLSAKAVYI